MKSAAFMKFPMVPRNTVTNALESRAKLALNAPVTFVWQAQLDLSVPSLVDQMMPDALFHIRARKCPIKPKTAAPLSPPCARFPKSRCANPAK
jgi:hypothetical protein